MTPARLVVNGCSYMQQYDQGNGHGELATHLQLNDPVSLAIGGSTNNRILRTTLKHSYTAPPTFYILGMTFLSRHEIPVCKPLNDFEGRWVNPQNQDFSARWQYGWTQKDSEQYIDIKLKTDMYSTLDRIEDLMYRMLGTISDLKSRGHRVLMFQQADNFLYTDLLDDPRLKLFDQPEIVGKFKWRAVPWQFDQGAAWPPEDEHHDRNYRHVAPGQHYWLNQYLTNYIQEHKILE